MIEGHGDDIFNYKHTIVSNFSSNVYGRTDLSGLKKYLSNHLDCISSYPEPEAESLRRKIAEYHRIHENEISVTNGATEAIYLIAQTFAGSYSAVVSPTFSEYADACRIHRHKIRYLFSLDRVPEDARIIWICNPNNPTGKVWNIERMKELIEKLPDMLFVIDQSYEDYTEKTLLKTDEMTNFPNVIMLHSLTKRYAVPGLRLGYLTAHRSLVGRLRANRMPWSVNAPAIVAGHYLLKQQIEKDDVMLHLAEARYLTDELNRLGFVEVWPSDTHILLCHLRMGTAAALKDYLAGEHGILIRDASNFEGLDSSYFRLAAQTRQENVNLIKAMKEWMES